METFQRYLHSAKQAGSLLFDKLVAQDDKGKNMNEAFENGYKCGTLLGKGGFGSVYAGQRLSDGLQVAIKQVASDFVPKWTRLPGGVGVVPMEVALLLRLQSGSKARRSLGHRGVICMLDWFKVPGKGFIMVFERPQPCQDLYEYITEKGSLAESLAQRFLRQIIEALQFCHARGIVHRDIKDENILVNTQTGDVKIIDFGSGALFKNTAYSEFEGTRLYSPPVWIVHKRYQAEALTAWSLGVLLFDMVCGDIPFQTDRDITHVSLNFTKRISKECQSLICWCLAYSCENRPSLEQMLKHPWMEQEEKGFEAGDLPDHLTCLETMASCAASP